MLLLIHVILSFEYILRKIAFNHFSESRTIHLLNHSPRSCGSPYSNSQNNSRTLWRSSPRVRSGSLFAPTLWRVALTFRMQTPSSFRMFNCLVLHNCIRSSLIFLICSFDDSLIVYEVDNVANYLGMNP